MKIMVYRSNPEGCLIGADIGVGTSGGRVCLSFTFGDGAAQRFLLSPKDAVMLWRCLMGEEQGCMVSSVDEDKLSLEYEEDASLTAVRGCRTYSWSWNISANKVKDMSFKIDANQALALAWALEKAVEKTVEKTMSPEAEAGPKRQAPLTVWVLTAHRMLTGDSAGEGLDLIGGHSEVFSSKEKAEDRLREFMRPLVNEAHPAHSLDGAETNVDDILDGVIDEVQHLGDSVWTKDHYQYDGSTQSFTVELENKMVDERHV